MEMDNRGLWSYLCLTGEVKKTFKTKQSNTINIGLQAYEDVFLQFTVNQFRPSTYLYGPQLQYSHVLLQIIFGPAALRALCVLFPRHLLRKREVSSNNS